MRILLIYPPISINKRYSSEIGHAGGKQIPLGLFYLASYIQANNREVRVIDAEALGMSKESLLKDIRLFRPQIIGISSTTVAFQSTLLLAKMIKGESPHIVIVLGGPHPSAAVEDVMQHGEIDYVIIGEGEESFSRLLSALENNDDVGSIAGTAFRDKGGSFKIAANSSIPLDINALPFPAYKMIPDFKVYAPPPMNYKKLPVVNIITSRGCPNQCTFCGHSVFGRTLRQRSPENVADEIELLYKEYNIKEIAFVDDTFTINPQRIRDLFTILNKRQIYFPWTCMSRINTVNADVLRYMKEQGCWHISFGIESGNSEILKLIKKNISLHSTRIVIENCHRIGLLTKGFFIVGNPGETTKTINESIEFALDIPLDDIVVTLNTPLPGTKQYRTAGRYGHVDRSDWTKYNMWNPVFIPDGLSEKVLLEKQREFYRRFYFRPHIMRRYAFSFLSRSGWRRAKALLRSLPFIIRRPKERI